MKLTPIGLISMMETGTKLEMIEGTIVSIYPNRAVGTNQFGAYSFESVKFRGADGQEIKLKFDGFEPLNNNWVNCPMRITGGITVDDYQGKKNVKVKAQTSKIDWNIQFSPLPPSGPPASQYGPPQGQHHYQPPAGPPPGAHGPPQGYGPPAGPPAQSYGPPPSQYPPQQYGPPQQAPVAPKAYEPPPIFGATVGMSINQAVKIIMGWNPPAEYYTRRQFSVDLHQTASDIIRVASQLENGKLAASASRREKNGTPAAPPPQKQEQHWEPDHSQLPPPPAFQSGSTTPGPDDDEIPF